MKKLSSILFFALCFSSFVYTQTLVDTFSFAPNTQLNSFWGITSIGDKLYLGADGGGDIYEVSQMGEILNTITTPAEINFNHGMVSDGNSFWVAEDFTSSGASLYNLDLSGNVLSSFVLPPVIGGNSSGVGGLALDGFSIWYSVYYPDFDVYPFNYAYLIKPNEMVPSDTIPLYGEQVYGLAVKGDTIFYVTDDLGGDEERIYAYSRSLGDTLYSFPLLDPDGDSSPRGLHWDGDYLWLIAKRPGGSAFAFSMLYKYEIESPVVQLFPEMSLSIDTLPFDTVSLMTLVSLDFKIKNTGNADLTITDFSLNNMDFSLNVPNTPLVISPGDSAIAAVIFTPFTEGFYESILTITSNGQNNPIQQVPITGTGILKVATEEHQELSSIKVFPNPVKHHLNLEIEAKNPIQIELELVDALGRKVEDLFVNKSLFQKEDFSFDLSHLISGSYFLIVKNKGSILKTVPIQIE